MIVATFASSFLNEVILVALQKSNEWLYVMAFASLLLGIGVFLDLQAKFYTHSKK